MNATTYDTKTKVAKIQPGSDWGHAYTALNPYGVTAVGGRASIVGVGGFTTGGGVSGQSKLPHGVQNPNQTSTLSTVKREALLAMQSPTLKSCWLMVPS